MPRAKRRSRATCAGIEVSCGIFVEPDGRLVVVCANNALGAMQRRPKLHFSLHFERDFEALSTIEKLVDRNVYEVLGYFEPGAWERLTRAGVDVVKRWVDTQVSRADAVIVLVGAQTFSRPIVRYEIARAAALKRGLFGLSLDGKATKNRNPFEYVTFPAGVTRHTYPVFDPPDDHHATVMNTRIAEALRVAGRA
jgi:hypothetical protein